MIEINSLTSARIDEAVDMMLTAFKDEALTSSWLDVSDPGLKDAYSTAVKIIYFIHLNSGDPIYIAIENDRIVGVAALSTPYTTKLSLNQLF